MQAFQDRAATYEGGWRGRMHHEIALHTASVALATGGEWRRVLDVGCGTGFLLRTLAERAPTADELVGIDAAPGMIEGAKLRENDGRLQFLVGVAEELPFSESTFDLVVSTTSFDHWKDQQAGLLECARVLRPGGHLVLTDLFSVWMLPTFLVGRRDRARTKHRAEALLLTAGFHSVNWHGGYAAIIATALATK